MGRFFADKSTVLRFLSGYRNAVFCRPKGFGSTILNQMIQEYYDIKNAKTEDFEKLFGHLEIGEKK